MYTNSHSKDELRCPKGHKVDMLFTNFYNKGCRCLKCSGSEKFDHEFVFNEYAKEGYIMKNIYKNCDTPDELLCPRKHDVQARFSYFRRGDRCRFCKYENIQGENHPKFNPDRTRVRRCAYLSFNLNKIQILRDDPNYDLYLSSYNEAEFQRKLTGNKYIKSIMSVDHILPRVAFIDNNLDEIYDKKVIKKICNLRENLRIIPKEENGTKSGKYNQDEFMKWFMSKINT
jgi:hypothetical protein